MSADAKEEFAAFFDAAERRLRLALTGAFGVETGHDATAEALAWAWQNWGDVREMTDPVGYIYRVGRTRALRGLDRDVASTGATIEAHPSDWEIPNFEPNWRSSSLRSPSDSASQCGWSMASDSAIAKWPSSSNAPGPPWPPTSVGASGSSGIIWGWTMSSHSETELRRWIQEVAATSEPTALDDVLDWGPIDSDHLSSIDVTDPVTIELAQPARERQMSSKRAGIILAVAAAVIAVVAFAVTSGDGSNGNDVAAERDEPTATAPADEETTVTAPAPTPAQLATEFWEALEANDRQAALGLVDPTALDSRGPVPFGRSYTLEGAFDWYEAVDWQWQLNECIERRDGAPRCSASANNPWSEALGVEPVTATFIVRFGENGIIEVEDQFDNFLNEWGSQVFGVFAEWVTENHPDDAAVMFDFSVDVNPEILSLYEVNTARFVEAQQTE
jgi:hypothetical protein